MTLSPGHSPTGFESTTVERYLWPGTTDAPDRSDGKAGLPAKGVGAQRRKRYTTTADYLSMMRRVMKAAGRRVGEADAEELAELIAIRDEMNQVIQRAVNGLREDGYTWESIGAATGTTRQAALMKWGPTRKNRLEVP